MTPARPEQDHDEQLRLQRIIALIDDLDRLKGNPQARQLAIERMRKELDAAKKPSLPETTH
jgi:hypothetical protein